MMADRSAVNRAARAKCAVLDDARRGHADAAPVVRGREVREAAPPDRSAVAACVDTPAIGGAGRILERAAINEQGAVGLLNSGGTAGERAVDHGHRSVGIDRGRPIEEPQPRHRGGRARPRHRENRPRAAADRHAARNLGHELQRLAGHDDRRRDVLARRDQHAIPRGGRIDRRLDRRVVGGNPAVSRVGACASRKRGSGDRRPDNRLF